MKHKRFLACLLALAIVIGLLPAISPAVYAVEASDTYTFNDHTTFLGTNWNPHAYEDEKILQYLQTPFVDLSIKDTATNEYQWIFLAVTDIRDVTSSNQADLAKYGCDVTTATEGYVYEFSLQPDMAWEDGTPIDADTYIYSMQALLDPEMQNDRADTYIEGVVTLAGAKNYRMSGQSGCYPARDVFSAYTTDVDDQLIFALGPGMGANSYLRDYVGFPDSYDLAMTIDWMCQNWGFPATYEEVALIEGKTLAEIKADESLNSIWENIINWWKTSPNEELDFFIINMSFPEVEFDTVGLYKVDDYTIRFVCQSAVAYYTFLDSMTTNWLVYEPMYEACKDLTTTPVTSTYGTSVDTTMSYGPYRLETYEANTRAVLVRNEYYFEYDVDASGNITSTTSFLVDGAYVPQWTTDRIVINVLPEESAAQTAFLAGELDIWEPSYSNRSEYRTSERLYKQDQRYTMRLFFNCDLDALKNMDEQTDNQNSVVLSNYNFRKALSLAIDREACAETVSGKPAYTLISDAYYYDAYNDPASIYRNSPQAKQAMCELYGVEYTEENYNAITGFDLQQAKALMAEACQELVAQGLYTEGEPIWIQLPITLGTVSEEVKNMVDCLNCMINAAAKGSGFGKIILEPIGGVNGATAVPNGQYAIGFSGWGGGINLAYRMLTCYTEAGFNLESGCWDPYETELTLTIDGVEETMTYAEWTASLQEYGKYADASHDVKQRITAQVEKNLLNLYYCIPLYTMFNGHLLSYKVSYYTEIYNQLCGFGGLRLMRYHYSDAQWEAYIAANELDYSDPVYDYEFDYSTENVEPEVIASGICGENLTWTLDENGVLTISGTGDMYDFASDNMPWADYAEDIKFVEIEDGATSIGDFAFFSLEAMTDISIANSVTSIGQQAFSFCASLTEVKLPEGLTSISDALFFWCENLISVEIPDSVTSIGMMAFSMSEKLTDVKLPSGLTSIGMEAFYCCNLTSVVIPNTLTSIDDSAFSACTNLTSVTLQDGLTSIGSSMFSGCTALTEIAIPDSVTSIGAGAFFNCTALTSVTIPEGVTTIGQIAFYGCSGLTQITFLGDAPSIGENAFYDVEATAYYPADNDTWTEEVMRSYGGTITWVASGAPAYAMGDVNGDSAVDTTDAKLIMQYDLGMADDTALSLSEADVNGDGSIDTTDAKLIMQLDLGIITEFP